MTSVDVSDYWVDNFRSHTEGQCSTLPQVGARSRAISSHKMRETINFRERLIRMIPADLRLPNSPVLSAVDYKT